ncbi:hypothetical protein [Actinoplanes sp. URMC 104]|uniref:hypothetical protein n=1 Tax=Actinoplanes sp. URMC 104 TaxID=3423409 RepID=UPI003F1CC575
MNPAAVLPAPAPPAPPRPAVVTVAFWFQVALVGLLLLAVGVSIADAVRYDGLIDEAARTTTADPLDVASERDGNVTGLLVAGLPLTVLALWLGITVLWVRRGNNVARILTWVGLAAPIGLLLLACVFGSFIGLAGLLLFGLLAGPLEEEPAPVGEDAGFDDFAWEDGGFYDRLWTLDGGGWSLAYDAVRGTSLAVAFLFAIATAVLLLTGPANRYFRPDRAGANPPRQTYGPMPFHPPMPPAFWSPPPFVPAPGPSPFGPPAAPAPPDPFVPPPAPAPPGPFVPPPASGGSPERPPTP